MNKSIYDEKCNNAFYLSHVITTINESYQSCLFALKNVNELYLYH